MSAVKVLDFGLAKALEPVAGRVDATASPTITSPAMMTGVGVLLGTAAYMSPEQARGKAVDKRSDIWAFGCVLYEMLTGKRAFGGDDVSETFAAVLKVEPDWNYLPANARGAVRRLLRRCLQKDSKDRIHDISDARIEIQEAQAKTDSDVTTAVTPVSFLRSERVAWTLLAFSTLALAVLTMLYLRRTVPEPVVTRLEVVTPPTTDAFSFALSPDGRQMVFVANSEKGPQLWLRPLDRTTAQPLPDTEGAGFPFWAPDGRAIGFFAGGKLKRVTLEGGPVQVLADAPSGRGGTWNAEGVIVFAPNTSGALMRVSSSGGAVMAVTQLAPGQASHRWPQFLPNGRQFLFLSATGLPQSIGTYVGSLDDGEPRRIMAASTAAYAAAGYLLVVSEGVLAAYPFDAARASVTGELIPVAQGVGTDDGSFHSAFSVSEQGVLAHRAGAGSTRELVWVDRTGAVQGALGSQLDDSAFANPEIAPDGRRVSVNRTEQTNADIWLLETARGVPSRLTFDASTDGGAIWSPDGNQIVFRSTRRGLYDLFQKHASGTVDEHLLLAAPENESPLDWSLDGRFLLYGVQDPKTAADIWALPLGDGRKPFAVLRSPFEEIQGQLSPDGRWLAYASNESGRYEIYVRPFADSSSGKWLISAVGGMQPRWRRDGRELFYVAPDTRLMAVPIRFTTAPQTLEAGEAVALFPTRLATGGNIPTSGWQARAQYAISSDGRFLLNRASDDGVTSPITIEQNWTGGLETR